MKTILKGGTLPLGLALLLAACSGSPEAGKAVANEAAAGAEAATNDTAHADAVTLSADQIAAAGVQIGRPLTGGAGTIDLPSTIEGDPQRTQVVSAAIGGLSLIHI